MTSYHKVNFVDVFSTNPGGRARKDGEFSGEKFREEVLIPLLAQHKYIELDISDAYGLGSSFLEEAFGGLVRINGMNKREVLHRLNNHQLKLVGLHCGLKVRIRVA